MNNRYKIICALFWGVAVWSGLLSCSSEEDLGPKGQKDSEAYIKIELNISDYKIPTDKEKNTKAMGYLAEKAIKYDLLNILVFKSDDKFYYKAPARDLTVENTGKATVTIKLVKPDNNESFNIVVIANHDMSSMSMIENTTTKSEILEQLKYTINTSDRKWNAATGSSTPFPMWAEVKDITISENMLPISLNLYRALAKVDVGLAFKMNSDGTLTEEVAGLDHFKLKEVKVYRTYKEGQAAPLKTDYTTTPSIPLGSTRYGDDEPLTYTMTAPTDSYLHEIYLPEADIPSNPSNNNIHCIVVGGYYEGSSDITYYRLDFEEIKNGAPATYLPLLRNYRYIFNILNVIGCGFPSPDQALKSTSSGNKVEYKLIKWDENIHEMHVEGKYYFGIDSRLLVFRPRPTIRSNNNVRTIKYQTNYPLSQTDGITFEWESMKTGGERNFEAKWNEDTQLIRITALKTNDTGTILTDVLYVKAGPFIVTINIQQECL